MQPAPIQSPVPTLQRPINGAVSGLAAQLGGNLATSYLMASGIDPANATLIGTAAGAAVSAVFATIGDLARGAMERPGVPWWAKTLLQLPARIG